MWALWWSRVVVSCVSRGLERFEGRPVRWGVEGRLTLLSPWLTLFLVRGGCVFVTSFVRRDTNMCCPHVRRGTQGGVVRVRPLASCSPVSPQSLLSGGPPALTLQVPCDRCTGTCGCRLRSYEFYITSRRA